MILENYASSFSDRDTNRAGNELFYSFHIVTCYLMLLQFLSNSESMKFIEKIAQLCGFTLLLNFIMLTVKKHQHIVTVVFYTCSIFCFSVIKLQRDNQDNDLWHSDKNRHFELHCKDGSFRREMKIY